ncbi:SDR family oxidoreductase [Shewanella corallii]|uniref:SDR family oxidoreductase n=1 Tax=Shewanella corallii TaxID=560080 RepID=A0ABT0NAV8_9GAMM|nr:SDR family oxidoreductase [Shewanella corallii]MCL2915495.1 SDR family oxidoreductase [Shewanella corallii]
MSLANKSVIITGACGNVGEAAANLFYQQGAQLVLTDLSQRKLQEKFKHFSAERCRLVDGNITEETTNIEIVSEAMKQFGKLDGFLANAGIEGQMGPIADADVDSFDKVMAVNVRSVWLGVKHVSKAMQSSGGGSIVITSSVGGVTGSPFVSAYITSKHAVVGIMRSLALELGADNIRVNTVHPCGVEGRMIEHIRSMLPPGAIEKSLERQALARLVNPSEVAGIMRFLISDESRMCTGGCYNIDGGYST